MGESKVVIIILNWNGKQNTVECLNSIKNINYSNYEIVIVDNGSTDGSPYILDTLYPKIKKIYNNKNYGFAEGNNIAIRYSMKNKPDYFLLLNNDTIVEKNFLTELVKVGNIDMKAGILGPVIKSMRTKKIQTTGFKLNMLTGSCSMIKNMPYIVTERDSLSGCALLIKSKVIEQIGLLDKLFFCYWEETDFCVRARKLGYKCVVVPKSEIFHKGGESSTYAQQVYYLSRNKILFMRKNVNNVNFSIFMIINLTYNLFYEVFVRIAGARLSLVYPHIYGIYKGLKDMRMLKI